MPNANFNGDALVSFPRLKPTIQFKRPGTIKPGTHLCDKHNTSEISITTGKKEHVCFFLVLMLMLISLVLCLSHKCEPDFRK